MVNKRKDKTKKTPRYKQTEDEQAIYIEKSSLGKNALLLVEGETEEAYFENLKKNAWLSNSLAGIEIQKIGNLGTALAEIKKYRTEARFVWIVVDNDKQNAFVLEENSHPFFENLSNEQLPETIRSALEIAYNQDRHTYFLSAHDYLLWLKLALGSDATIEYWDRIQHFTPTKAWLFKKFDNEYIKNPQENIKLAYSCIAFEFWLILHFEKNTMPFLWVDKEKSAEVDVGTYFKTLKPNYEKGYFDTNGREKPCNAYTCLYDDFNKEIQTRIDEWRVLTRIFTAYRNASWLQEEMQVVRKRQSDKWYEVNPYILGIDNLMAELLNIKHLRVDISYFNLTIQFDFNIQNAYLTMQIGVDDGMGFEIDHRHRLNFEIRDEMGNSFTPSIEIPLRFPNDNTPVNFQYDIPQPINTPLVLVFNDPRSHSKSSQLFILLN